MLCQKCRKKESNPETHLSSLCNGCFLEQIEKRVRKELRENDWVKKNERILLVKDNSKEFFVTECLFNSILKEFPLNVETVETEILSDKLDKYDKILIPWDMDDEISIFLNEIFNNERYGKAPDKIIKLLKNVSDKEVELFAKLKGFTFGQKNKTPLQEAMNLLEKKYPGSKFALLNAQKQIKEL